MYINRKVGCGKSRSLWLHFSTSDQTITTSNFKRAYWSIVGVVVLSWSALGRNYHVHDNAYKFKVINDVYALPLHILQELNVYPDDQVLQYFAIAPP